MFIVCDSQFNWIVHFENRCVSRWNAKHRRHHCRLLTTYCRNNWKSHYKGARWSMGLIVCDHNDVDVFVLEIGEIHWCKLPLDGKQLRENLDKFWWALSTQAHQTHFHFLLFHRWTWFNLLMKRWMPSDIVNRGYWKCFTIDFNHILI